MRCPLTIGERPLDFHQIVAFSVATLSLAPTLLCFADQPIRKETQPTAKTTSAILLWVSRVKVSLTAYSPCNRDDWPIIPFRHVAVRRELLRKQQPVDSPLNMMQGWFAYSSNLAVQGSIRGLPEIWTINNQVPNPFWGKAPDTPLGS